MKRILALLLITTICSELMAEDYQVMTFENNDGSQTSIAASGLTITFANGQLIGVNGNTSMTLPLTQLQKMFFSNTTSIDSPAKSDDTPTSIYTLNGVLVGMFSSFDEAKSQLHSGVYIVKTDKKTFKTTIK